MRHSFLRDTVLETKCWPCSYEYVFFVYIFYTYPESECKKYTDVLFMHTVEFMRKN